MSGFFLVKLLLPPILWSGERVTVHSPLRPSGVTVHLLEGALILRCLDSCTDVCILYLFSHVYQDSWIYILHFGLYFDYYLIYFAAQCFYFYSLLFVFPKFSIASTLLNNIVVSLYFCHRLCLNTLCLQSCIYYPALTIHIDCPALITLCCTV